jgi:outer membrane protein insertion porin family
MSASSIKRVRPTQGRTKEDFIKRELKLKSGEVFRVDVARQDLQQLYKLGLFDNANISLNGDARNVDVTYDLIERLARGVNVGGGYSADTGLFGTINYKDQNFGGINQQVGVNLQVGSRDVQFDGNYTSPYRASNPDMPGYSVNAFGVEPYPRPSMIISPILLRQGITTNPAKDSLAAASR